jgi:hypothetical protein
MDSQPWLSRVRKRLAKHALPPSYVQRFMEELADHLADLKEEGMDQNSSSRLGEPEQVAEAAVTAYRRRSFLGRHPAARFLVFGVSPAVSLVVLFIASSFSLMGLGMICERLGFNIDQGSHMATVGSALMCLVMSLLTIIIPSILASIAYCRLARRVGMGTTWVIGSCAIVAVLASFTSYWRAGSGYWMLGFLWSGFFRYGSLVALTQHVVNLSIPLAIGLWFLRRKHDEGQLQLAS